VAGTLALKMFGECHFPFTFSLLNHFALLFMIKRDRPRAIQWIEKILSQEERDRPSGSLSIKMK
jgi:hypothetical protein